MEQGDTLYLLGKKYQVSVAAIMYANPFVDIYNLQVGDELCIPRIMLRGSRDMRGDRGDMRGDRDMRGEREEMRGDSRDMRDEREDGERMTGPMM